MANVTSSLLLPKSVWKDLTALAEAQGISRSKLVERLLADSLAEEKTINAAFGNPVIRDALVRACMSPGFASAVATALAESDPSQYQLFKDAMSALAGPEKRLKKKSSV